MSIADLINGSEHLVSIPLNDHHKWMNAGRWCYDRWGLQGERWCRAASSHRHKDLGTEQDVVLFFFRDQDDMILFQLNCM